MADSVSEGLGGWFRLGAGMLLPIWLMVTLARLALSPAYWPKEVSAGEHLVVVVEMTWYGKLIHAGFWSALQVTAGFVVVAAVVLVVHRVAAARAGRRAVEGLGSVQAELGDDDWHVVVVAED